MTRKETGRLERIFDNALWLAFGRTASNEEFNEFLDFEIVKIKQTLIDNAREWKAKREEGNEV